MDLDRLLEHFEADAGQKEQVALIFYYLETFEGDDDILPSAIKDEIRCSRSTISPSSVSTYISRLDSEWITSTENDGYRLTNLGEKSVEELLDEEAIQDHRDEDDRFIDTDVFDEYHHERLVDDVNECYRRRIYDAALVLNRKLFEDIVYKILKTHYAGGDVQMFYDLENERHYHFDELLDNFKEGVPVLRQYSKRFDKEVVEDLRDLKNEGNTGAHSIKVDFDDDEVEELSEDTTRIAEIIEEVWWGVRQADRVQD